jgi:putative membrane protein insertion efficiency factor
MKRIAQSLIKGYALLVSPFLGQNCRFYPTCYAYAHDAIEHHGVFKGIGLSIKRIAKCHPYYKGEYEDPVPAKSGQNHQGGDSD